MRLVIKRNETGEDHGIEIGGDATAFELKEAIEVKTGIRAADQVLVPEDDNTPLDNRMTLTSQDVRHEDVLILSGGQGLIDINVAVSGERNRTMSISSEATVASLYRSVKCVYTQFDEASQILTFSGRIIDVKKDSGRTLRSLEIVHTSTITVTKKCDGGRDLLM